MGFSELFDDLNPTLKEEIFFHQFSDKIDHYDLFYNISDQDCKLSLMKCLKKVTYEKHSKIYLDNTITDSIYFVIQGKVKLIGENNNFAFAHFNAGEVFGETDVLCDINRNGTAVTIEHSTLYTIDRDSFVAVIVNFPENHHNLINSAL
jgi:CRP-like cAMP-binding protein